MPVDECGVFIEEVIEVRDREVAGRGVHLGPVAVLPEFADEPVDQIEFRRDLTGAPGVQRRPVGWAEAVVLGLAQVRRDRAPPSLAAVCTLGYLLDDPGVGEHAQVIALACWAIWLGSTLPPDPLQQQWSTAYLGLDNYSLTWVGLDCIEVLGLAACGLLFARGAPGARTCALLTRCSSWTRGSTSSPRCPAPISWRPL
jgi:hypothetical protein